MPHHEAELFVDGAKSDLTLTSFEFDERMGEGFSGHVIARSRNTTFPADQILGKSVTVRLDVKNGGQRYFNAIAARFRAEGVSDQQHFTAYGSDDLAAYRIDLVPWTWLLRQRQTCRIFRKKTAREIIKHVVDEALSTADNLEAGEVYIDKLTDEYRPREMCVQYNETDENFIFRLIAEEGISSHFIYTSKSHTLVLTDSPGSFSNFDGYTVVEYRPPASQEQPPENDTVYFWDAASSIAPLHYQTHAIDWRDPGALDPASSDSTKEVGVSNCRGSTYVWPGAYRQNSEQEKERRVGVESLRSDRATAEGKSKCRGLSAGHTIEVMGFHVGGPVGVEKDKDATNLGNGKFLISTVHHEVSITLGRSGGGSEMTYSNEFTAQPPNIPYRVSDKPRKPRIPGIQTARVAGKAGEEIYVSQGEGKPFGTQVGMPPEAGQPSVILHFPWDRHGGLANGFPRPLSEAKEGVELADENASGWVRVAQGMAGAGWGMQFIPRVGQEVVVQFLDGDPDYPLVTGAVYNGETSPPFALPKNKTQSGIKTRSSQGGGADNFNQILFEDKKGEELLSIQAEKNETILVKNNAKRTVGANRTKSVGGNENSHVIGDRESKVDKTETLHIGATRTVNVAQTQMFDIEGDFIVDSGAHLKLEAAESIEIACGPCEIRLDKHGNLQISGVSINETAEGGFIIAGGTVDINSG